MNNLPKVLIVSRLVWDDTSNSNTLGNLFKNYDPDRIARIYIESKSPNTNCCYRFYQISEFSLVKKLFNWRLSTGRIIDTRYDKKVNDTDLKVAKNEASTFNFVRGHRLWIFSILRDILWSFNGWKSKELKQFIHDFNPDIIWLDGSPLILMNRLNNYVLKESGKPAVTFLMDDVYDYRSCASIWDKIYKYFLRKHVKKTVKSSKHVFVASPKMKEEYDQTFGINSTFITKSIDKNLSTPQGQGEVHIPIKLIYLGNVLIGRLDTICTIAQAIKQINQEDVKIEFDIYTGDKIDSQHQDLLNVPGVRVHGLVPYNEVPAIIANSDVQVFVESISGRKRSIARLSFSTKIIDYLTSGKCVLAVGPKDVAPIEYFRNEDAAIAASTKEEIIDRLNLLLQPGVIAKYAHKAVDCGHRNHNRQKMDKLIFDKLKEIAK